jgi:hypothetical protein
VSEAKQPARDSSTLTGLGIGFGRPSGAGLSEAKEAPGFGSSDLQPKMSTPKSSPDKSFKSHSKNRRSRETGRFAEGHVDRGLRPATVKFLRIHDN